MGEKSIKKETKKKKKTDVKATVPSAIKSVVVPQPELIKKKKNPM